MDVNEFFKLYQVKACDPLKVPSACDDCDLNEKCGEFFFGCPLPLFYVFKLKK